MKKTATVSKPAAAAPREPKAEILSEQELRAMPESAYMNDAQLAFFRSRLLEMRQEIVLREGDARERLNHNENHADPADRATAEEEYFLDMRLREREARLLRKIDEALARIRNKEYGYCEQTGEPIGIPRLLVRPTATVCVDVKDRDERLEQSRAS
jgi:DnaK suppressor protein